MRAALLSCLVLVAAAMLPATAAADPIHVVAPGESLTSIAATDGLTVSALAAANELSPTAELLRGEVIVIPAQTAGTAAPSSSTHETSSSQTTTAAATSTSESSAPSGGGVYVVRWGDTLTAIAADAGTTVAELAALNGLNPDGVLLAGSLLKLPGSTTATSTTYVSDDTQSSSPATHTTASTSTVAAQTTGPDPTVERVSGGEIAGIADADGVPASLAEAIAWQESGWNNDVVSDIGAVGVMQIVPSTWGWIDQYLTPDDPLAPASASENVRAGVLLLHDLLLLTGDNYAEAVAGYYQGLQSVEKHGMYPDTRQYVADVLALADRFAA